VRVIARDAQVRLGPWYALDHRPYDFALLVYDLPLAPARGWRVVARVAIGRSGASSPLTLALRRVPGQPPLPPRRGQGTAQGGPRPVHAWVSTTNANIS
jgi:hypothetical protein